MRAPVRERASRRPGRWGTSRRSLLRGRNAAAATAHAQRYYHQRVTPLPPPRPQVGVMGDKSQRDGRRQTRLVRGDAAGLRIYTVRVYFVCVCS